MNPKLLLAQLYHRLNLTTMNQTPQKFKAILEQAYPQYLGPKADPKLKTIIGLDAFNRVEDYPTSIAMDNEPSDMNVSGNVIAQNLTTPTTVIENNVTSPDQVLKELAKGDYTHVGFSLYTNGIETFIETAKLIRKQYPELKILVGCLGAHFGITEKYADYICKGEGIRFLRSLFGENVNAPYKMPLIPGYNEIKYLGKSTKTDSVALVTKMGCPHSCDFCPTYRIFEGKVTNFQISPQIVFDTLTSYRQKLGRDFTTYFIEPTAILSRQWWYDLFDLFKEVDGDYPLYMPTTSSSLNGFDFNHMNNSALRFDSFNIGIESLNRKYTKNVGVHPKALIDQLRDLGIGILLTYIIGFDYHTKENIWEEIRELANLDTHFTRVLNLRPFPGTELWNQLKIENRLLDLPAVLSYIDGFQPYLHPHFRPGFTDMLPLLYEINKYLERETGFLGLKMIETLKNSRKVHPGASAKLDMMIQLYSQVSKVMYPSWKAYFQPTEKRQQHFDRILML